MIKRASAAREVATSEGITTRCVSLFSHTASAGSQVPPGRHQLPREGASIATPAASRRTLLGC